MTNLVADLRTAVREHPDATAVSVAGTDTTYAEFWAMTGRFAGALEDRGFEPGASVALYLPNLPQYLVAFYGVLRAGGTVVPVDPAYGPEEISHPLADSAAVAIVTSHDHVAHIEAVHERTILRFMVTAEGPGEYSTGFSEFLAEGADVLDYWKIRERVGDDVAVLPYVGGERSVELTHNNLAAGAEAIEEFVPDGITTDDGVLGAVPFHRGYGLAVVATTLANGATVYPLRSWDAGEALALIDAEGLTILPGLPGMYEDLLDHPGAADRDLSTLRLATVVGDGAPLEGLNALEEWFDVTVYEGYAPTDIDTMTHCNAPTWGRRPGSVGKPVHGVDARVVDEAFDDVPAVEEGPVDEPATGEFVVAGQAVPDRYHGLPDETERDFSDRDDRRWFHTGDVGYRDEDGFYYVVEHAAVGEGPPGAAPVAEPADDESDAGGDDAQDSEEVVEAEVAAGEQADSPAGDDGDESGPAEGTTQGGGDAVTELQALDGISESRAATLREAGFESVGDIRTASHEELTQVEGFGDALVDRIKAQLE